MIVQTIGALITVIACSVMLEAPKKTLIYAGLVGAGGWLIYLLCVETLGVVSATFISGVFIALFSHLFARIFQSPVTVFLIPGFIPLVPGAGMYNTVYQFMQGNAALSDFYLRQTIQIAGMIALSIFVIDSLFRTHSKRNISQS